MLLFNDCTQQDTGPVKKQKVNTSRTMRSCEIENTLWAKAMSLHLMNGKTVSDIVNEALREYLTKGEG